jgi:hypothetical protein
MDEALFLLGGKYGTSSTQRLARSVLSGFFSYLRAEEAP